MVYKLFNVCIEMNGMDHVTIESCAAYIIFVAERTLITNNKIICDY
jgi:hypothetical protein